MTNGQQEMIEYTTQDIVEYIMKDNKLSMSEAMDGFYPSRTFSELADVRTGLYLQGSAHVYERYKAEIRKSA
ncbi:MAG: hypothetical protein LUC38_05770 [Oscillospiraceae bacterium]|nr:hypothetical protein [Oscillospiraceae bacterium]